MTYDSIIIGKGPAGISAAIYLVRAGHSVLVIGKDVGALEKAEHIENYYGFPETLTGAELSARGIAQAERLGVKIATDEAVQLGMEDVFTMKTAGGAEYRAQAVLLASGKKRTSIRATGFEEFRGKGISFCATCDGFFYRGKRIAVIGSGDYAASELEELLHFSKDVTVFTDGAASVSSHIPSGVPVITDKIVALEGASGTAGKLERLVTASASGERSTHAVDGVFVAVGTAGAADFAAKLGVEVSGSDIVVDTDFMTNLPGIFAAGDCIGGFLQVAKAVSDGALAAKGMIAFLKKVKSS